MSLDKAIAAGKERRKPYRGAGKNDPTCRPHGGCPYCARGRKHKVRRQEPLVDLLKYAESLLDELKDAGYCEADLRPWQFDRARDAIAAPPEPLEP